MAGAARAARPGPYPPYIVAGRLRAGLELEPDPRQLTGDYLRQRVAGVVFLSNNEDRSSQDSGSSAAVPAFARHFLTVCL